MNYVLIAAWESFKLSSAKIARKTFKKIHILPLSPPYIYSNHQACLAGTKQSNIEKGGGIGQITNASIASINLEAVRKIDPMVILR